MASKKARRGLPPGGRKTSSGRITITIRAMVEGEVKRLSHSKVLSTEPTTYATEREAWEGYDRVMDYLDQKAQDATTLRVFWKKWTDVDHHWNVQRGRSESTVQTYESRTMRFVATYGDMQLDQIGAAHLDAHLDAGGTLSHVGAISRIFNDATEHGLIKFNPMAQAARRATRTIEKQAKHNRKLNPPPKSGAIGRMLTRLREPVFPPSLYGWFLTGTTTGMRGGEIDGMEWEYLDGDRYHVAMQWHAKLNKRTECKHGSERWLRLLPPVMAAIEEIRELRSEMRPETRSRYIWTDPNRSHWTHTTRDYWWGWTRDGQPSPRQIAGGATMYNSTRHFWASKAVNELGLTPYQASLLYGHKDGGKLINEVYANPDHEAAMKAAYDAQTQGEVIDLSKYRDDDEGEAVAA